MADEQFQVYHHLVVSRPSAVNFLAYVAEAAREQQFHLRVDVFDAVLDDKLAAFTRRVDAFQFGQQLFKLRFFKKSD